MNQKEMIHYLKDNYVLGVDFKSKGNCNCNCFTILNNEILKDEVLIGYMNKKNNKLNK